MAEANGPVKHVLVAKFKDDVSPEKIEELINGYANLVNLIEPMKAFHWTIEGIDFLGLKERGDLVTKMVTEEVLGPVESIVTRVELLLITSLLSGYQELGMGLVVELVPPRKTSRPLDTFELLYIFGLRFDIQSLASSFAFISFAFIPRSENVAADSIAKKYLFDFTCSEAPV